ncbi:MAG: NADH-quinone oxidoreductase subunit J [Acidimicrobiales bacterium]|nr:NADH-quinone oxidoreductase subunit J [Acidimicrobiales bacterium]MCB1015036.1 NADH-quinone oxidoreductase subunit J [Acidimicrobiales bacterium]MCB9372545.1 NADH-quinone oxidoreductase subunit J [Microthrixaceae bacterium]
MTEVAVFVVSAAIVLAGAIGVIASRNPVHAALSLVATLFGIAVLFIAQDAQFLAAVQVIVYAGAIVVLFLFVLMLLGVDQAEDLSVDPLVGQRFLAAVAAVGGAVLLLLALFAGDTPATGARAVTAAISDTVPNINQLGRILFTDYVLAFEITAVLLTIAVVGAVALSRRGDDEPATDAEEGGR